VQVAQGWVHTIHLTLFSSDIPLLQSQVGIAILFATSFAQV
jgi:hypothetical protein